MQEWYPGITEQEFTNAINDAVVAALKEMVLMLKPLITIIWFGLT